MQNGKSYNDESALAVVFGWLVTPAFLLTSLLTLLIWHPVIAASRRVSSDKTHDWIIAFGNRLLICCFNLTGGNVRFSGANNLPKTGPVIVVSNHQSLFDIPILIWFLRGRHTKFIAKRSLGKGIPSASYVLRTNGHALIDRGDAAQAGEEIRRVAQSTSKIAGTVVIFPEGTRARNGVLKKFKSGGIKLLLSELPNAVIVPVSINGAWRIMQFGFLPVPFGVPVRVEVHSPIAETAEAQRVVDLCEDVIRDALQRQLLL